MTDDTDDDGIPLTVNSHDGDPMSTIGTHEPGATVTANDRGPDVTLALPSITLGGREDIRLQLGAEEASRLGERLQAAAAQAKHNRDE